LSRTTDVVVSTLVDADAEPYSETHREVEAAARNPAEYDRWGVDAQDAVLGGEIEGDVKVDVDDVDASSLASTPSDEPPDEPPDEGPDEAIEELLTGDGAVALGSMSDEDLLVGIRDQSEAHFTELYNRYFQRIYSFVYTRMRNHAEAEEVVQETFLAVFRSFERYRGQSSLLSWIYGIAKNTANNSIRRSKSQTERIDLADEEDLIPRPSLGVGTPGEQLDLHRFQDQLTERLGGLADWQAEIFEMRHFENLTIPEISERTRRSSDAVRSSLYRVKRIFLEAAQANGMTPALSGESS
jgi:RNA polymerase sigma-70 factor (ECF subfamily)